MERAGSCRVGRAAGRLTVWGTTKVLLQSADVASCWGSTRRASTSWVGAGGGFGRAANSIPRTSVPFCQAPRAAGQVVEDRREHFLTINHSREQHGLLWRRDERGSCWRSIHARDGLGGYLRTHGVWAARLTASYLPGRTGGPAYRCHVSCVMTNRRRRHRVARRILRGHVRCASGSSTCSRRAWDGPPRFVAQSPRPKRRAVHGQRRGWPSRAEADFRRGLGEMFEQALKAGRVRARTGGLASATPRAAT